MLFRSIENDGSIELFPKKERLKLGKERLKLDNTLGGIRNMGKLPGAIFIVDPKNEAIAIREGQRLNIPIVAIVDTNCDPDLIDYVIPGNDDAIRAIRLIASRIADACMEGRQLLIERKQAQADKDVEEPTEIESAAASLKPGERKVISDGSQGPIVEIIRKTGDEEAKNQTTEEASAPVTNGGADQTGE